MAGDDAATREELLQARSDLQQQLDIVSSPINGRDRNRVLEARLKQMIDDIDAALSKQTK